MPRTLIRDVTHIFRIRDVTHIFYMRDVTHIVDHTGIDAEDDVYAEGVGTSCLSSEQGPPQVGSLSCL
jgi:tRNA A58 N-methylase Trm61